MIHTISPPEIPKHQMLSLLSGRWHQVYTGVCAVDAQGMVHQRVVGTQVHFCPMTEEEIRRYIATGEPMDKAGAYAVQGIAGLWIDKLEGSYMRCASSPTAIGFLSPRREITSVGSLMTMPSFFT